MDMQTADKYIKLINWNCNGILNKIVELEMFLKKQNVDKAIITELRGLIDKSIKIRGYKTFKKQFKNNRGGVAILVNNRISCLEVQAPSVRAEVVSVVLNNSYLIHGIYNNPQTKTTETEWQTMLNYGGKVIIAGDLNAKHEFWNNSRNNKNGTTLMEINEKTTCNIWFPEQHSHIPSNGMSPSTIDLYITKNLSNILNIETVYELSSDHYPVVLELGTNIEKSEIEKQFNYKKGNWKRFRELISANINIKQDLNSGNEIDEQVEILTDVIQRAAEETIPKHEINTIRIQLSDEIKHWIRLRNKARKRWQKTRENAWYLEMKVLNKIIRDEITKHKNEMWQQKLEKLNVQDNSIWKLSKNLRTVRNNIPTLEENGQVYIKTQDKIELMSNKLQQVHKLEESNEEHNKIEDIVNNWKLQNNIEPAANSFITNSMEIKTIIRASKSNKAPGEDGLQYKLIKNLPLKALAQIIYIFNSIIRLGYYPSRWKKAEVICLLKPGKTPECVKSYRPISLLNTLSRILEKIIATRLDNESDMNNVIPNTQCGFRPGHNTEHQLNRIATTIIQGFKSNKITALELLDIEKAYDRVWITGLIYKMIKFNYHKNIIILIQSYLRDRVFRVKLGGAKGSYMNIENGLPQGSALSPKLFNIYLADLPEFPNTHSANFADDTAIYSQSDIAIIANRKLQLYNRNLETYFKLWKIKINSNKIENIIFARKHSNNKVIVKNKFGNEDIEISENVKYLGVVLNKSLNYRSHIMYIAKKAFLLIKKLYPLMANGSRMNMDNKLRLYKAIIRPTITYGCSVWQNTGKQNIIKLQRIQNKCLRIILGKDRFTRIEEMHAEANMEYLHEYIQKLSQNVFEKIERHENPLIQKIISIKRNTDWKTRYRLPYANLNIYEDA